MAAPYVKNVLNLTRMQFTASQNKPCHVREGLSSSSVGEMEAEKQGGSHILTQETPGNVQPCQFHVLGRQQVPGDTRALPLWEISPGAVWVSGLHSKEGPAKGSAADGELGILHGYCMGYYWKTESVASLSWLNHEAI